MTTLRSEDWSVRPSFVPNGPTSPVVLLLDETHLTQLAGIPSVAWQTPWSEVANIELIRFSHQMVLFATVGGVRYCWRQRQLTDFEAMSAFVLERGGVVTRRRRRAGVFAVVALVVVASFAGGVAAWFNRTSHADTELADARAINLTLRDLPSSAYASSDTPLGYLVTPNKVYTPTTTTALPKDAPYTEAATAFQSCLGVTNAADRLYGGASQQPDYQVSSSIFSTNEFGGVLLASTSQYYRTTTMVERDTHEMSMKNFGLCFATSSATLILAELGRAEPAAPGAVNWRPSTFTKGWSRAGSVPITVPGVNSKLQLVMVVLTRGHYEVTLSALVSSFARSEAFLAGAANTLLSRMATTSSAAV